MLELKPSFAFEGHKTEAEMGFGIRGNSVQIPTLMFTPVQ